MIHIPNNKISRAVPFPHTSISSFLGAVKDHITKTVYPHFGYSVNGSFDKAIQFLDQMNDEGLTSEHDMMSYLPMLVFTPTLEEPDRFTDFLWNYPDTGPYASRWNHKPIIFDNGSLLTISTRRMKGNIEMRIFCESYPEEHDIHLAFLNSFRGLNTYTPLNNIEMFMTFDDQVQVYTKDDGVVPLDLMKSTYGHLMTKRHIQSIDKERLCLKVEGAPLLQLTGMSDASSFYGGNGLSEYALSGSLSFELEIPNIIVLETNLNTTDVDFNMDMSFVKKS